MSVSCTSSGPVYIDALVINLYFLTGFHVVVQDHLFAAADDYAADFDRRQPVVVKVRNKSAFVIDR